MFDSVEKATAAAGKLRDAGYGDDLISVVSVAASGSAEGLKKALMAAFVLSGDAAVHARHAGANHGFVVVRAPFGGSVDAIDLLNSAGPVSTTDPTEVPDGPLWDDAAPFSSAIHMPPLAKWRPTGGAGALMDSGWSLFGALGLPELSASHTPTTEGMGMSLLSSNATPFSSLFKLPLLR
jgi:hypothetical protein